MSDVAWLAIAFGAVWLALGGYLMSIHLRQKDLERRIRQLRPGRSPDL
ncbi:MAG TPA: CcmD family protein [Actinomycetota bacterium]|nr:CcmD family protein [Actinomycetota bacterium]